MQVFTRFEKIPRLMRFQDVINSDFTPAWDVLRRLTHVAIRKYAQTNKLAELVAEIVDREIDEVLDGADEKRTGIVEFIETVLCSVLAISTAGDRSARSVEIQSRLDLFQLLVYDAWRSLIFDVHSSAVSVSKRIRKTSNCSGMLQ